MVPDLDAALQQWKKIDLLKYVEETEITEIAARSYS